jgi:hypothetical protein
MKKRSPVGIILLMVITLGIYLIVWYVETEKEMNNLGAKIVTPWLLIVPFVNLYWVWSWCAGISFVTKKFSPIGSFLLAIFLGPIAFAIFQNEFNKIASRSHVPVPTPAS